MGFDVIPAIPGDYPLYDWGNWQSSRDALVPGGPTKYFVKEAWNAIVDALEGAITAAGQTWDSTYTTASGAKITEAYGKLSARKFNSIRLNIDRQMHLNWPWAVNPANRGYVGREDFLGRQDVGEACDLVYPEYLLELVRKLNLLLEIMRGTGPVRDANLPRLSETQIGAAVRSGVGARVNCPHRVSTTMNTLARSAMASYAMAATAARSRAAAGMRVNLPTVLPYSRNVPSRISASGRSRLAAPAEGEPVALHSISAGEMLAVNRQRVPPMSVFRISGTVCQQDVNVNPVIVAAPNRIPNRSSVEAEARKARKLPTTAARISGSKSKAVGSVKRSRLFIPKEIPIQAAAKAELRGGLLLCTGSETHPGSHVQGGAESHLTIPILSDAVQSRLSGETELRIGTPNPISAAHNSRIGTEMDIGMAPHLPLTSEWRGSVFVEAEPDNGLASCVSATLHADSTTGAEPLAQRAEPADWAGLCGTSAVFAAEDTCWLSPVCVNGGLWIRQVHDNPVQRENGDLELT